MLILAISLIALAEAGAERPAGGEALAGTEAFSIVDRFSITLPYDYPDEGCDLDGDGLPDAGCDLADVYAPRIPPDLVSWFEDAFPLVVLLQGALVDSGQYARVARGIARQGFVVAVPNHLQTLPGHGLAPLTAVGVEKDAYEAVADADADPGSALYRIVDTETMGLTGHSFGGAMGLYAIAGLCLPGLCTEFPPPGPGYEAPAALRAAAFYGTNLIEDDGSVTPLDTSSAAVALLQGTLDGVSTPEEGELSYPELERPRALIEIEGANHFGICDTNNPPGALPDPIEPTLAQAKANFHVGRWMGLWLRAELKDDPWAELWINAIGGSLDGVVTVVESDP